MFCDVIYNVLFTISVQKVRITDTNDLLLFFVIEIYQITPVFSSFLSIKAEE